MKNLSGVIASFLLCDDGATAIEYGLLAGGIALAIVTTIFAFGSDLNRVFLALDSNISTAVSNSQAAAG